MFLREKRHGLRGVKGYVGAVPQIVPVLKAGGIICMEICHNGQDSPGCKKACKEGKVLVRVRQMFNYLRAGNKVIFFVLIALLY